MVRDFAGAPAFMAASVFDLKYDQDTWPEIVFTGHQGLLARSRQMVVKHGSALVTYQLIGKVSNVNTWAAQWRVAH